MGGMSLGKTFTILKKFPPTQRYVLYIILLHVYLNDSETGSDDNFELKSEEESETGSDSEDGASDSDQSNDDIIQADQSDSDVVSQEKGDGEPTGFSTISLASLQEDVEKGKAAKQQIGKSDTCR